MIKKFIKTKVEKAITKKAKKFFWDGLYVIVFRLYNKL